MTLSQRHTRSILIVEDDEFTSELLKFLLEREQYTVHLAPDGRVAQDFVANQPPPDLVLLDVMLPFASGFELLHQIRQRPDWEAVRIIMLTARSEGHEIANALDAGADDYLVKPFKPEELFARVRRLLPTTRISAS